jgi:ATP-binding cassette subfamily C protein
MSRLNLFLERLPEGINTIVGERGMRLSGGEKQRIALARAFYFQRQVIIMDEATSSLDNETEKEVIDSILSIKRKVTMIIIAHRLNTVKNCDFIYKLENGEIIESGTPKNIL